MDGYFSRFPTTEYNNEQVTNILRRVKISDAIKSLASLYYEYQITFSERADTIAKQEYNNSYNDWIVYYANDIIHPSLDWHKSSTLFDNYLIEKYGSLENAAVRTAYYRIDYTSDRTKLTQSEYDSLGASLKKYWVRSYTEEPSDDSYWRMELPYPSFPKFVRYERSKQLLYSDTNLIMDIGYVQTSGNDSPVVGDILQDPPFVTNDIVVRGEISYVSNTNIIIKNITNIGSALQKDFVVSAFDKDYKLTVTSVDTLSSPIPIEESIYWSDVSFYQHEMELNEARRLIRMFDSKHLEQIRTKFSDIMQSGAK